MEVIKFIVFFIISYFILMQIFNYSTYHKYLWKVFPLLVLYSGLAGYLLFYFGLRGGFLWQILLSIIFFISNSRKQDRQAAQVLNILDNPAKIKQLPEDLGVLSVMNSIDDMDRIIAQGSKAEMLDKLEILTSSYRKTKKYFWMSAITYLIVFSTTYIIVSTKVRGV